MLKKNNFKWINLKLKNFLFNFSNKKNNFKYRNKIRICSLFDKKTFEISLKDLENFENELYLYIFDEPLVCLNYFEFVINQIIKNYSKINLKTKNMVKKIQVILISNKKPKTLKDITLKEINKLVTIKIIVLSIGQERIKIGNFNIQSEFKKKNFNTINFEKNLNIINDKKISQTDFIDYQIIKVQDFFSKKTTKKTPRCIFLNVERELVGQFFPGKILILTGIYIENKLLVHSKKKKSVEPKNNKKTIIQVIGFKNVKFKNKNLFVFQNKILFDEEFLFYAQSKNIYNWIISSIVPDIYGFNEIKTGIACLLFGATFKRRFENLLFDKQLNILIFGKYSNFVSNINRFIKKFSPIVYIEKVTTAFLENIEKTYLLKLLEIRLKKKNFKKKLKYQIIFCLKDMEKYLNSNFEKIFEFTENEQNYKTKKYISYFREKKCSILANINPNSIVEILKNQSEKNFFFKNHISNFDLIFWAIREKSRFKLKDEKIAHHIISLNEKNQKFSENQFEWKKISFEMLKKYIFHVSYKTCPILTKSASEIIKNAYFHMRNFFKKKIENLTKIPIFISICHLESIIKISASLSKMKMADKITSEEALEAIRLFQKRFFQN
jgi:DNA replication licensing factor MCM2